MQQNSYLYYPLIQIPEKTLVHSVLFQDRVKRIIPPNHQMDSGQAELAKTPNEISQEYLGYRFIEDADYWESKEEIALLFCDFLDEIYNTKKPELYDHLLGKDYKNNFTFKNNVVTFGTQYFVYAHKFSEKVFDKLDSLGWMKYHNEYYACELSNELCNIYMSLLALSISKRTSEPMMTDSAKAESLLSSSIFKVFFRSLLPPTKDDKQENSEICINLIFNKNPRYKPIESLLSFKEAIEIRAKLESERENFTNLVNRFSKKVSLLNPADKEQFMLIEIEEIIDEARSYMNKVQMEAKRKRQKQDREQINYIKTGISITAPIAGALADSLAASSPSLGIWSTGGFILALSTLLIPEKSNENEIQEIISAKESAYLYMNKLWELQEKSTKV